MKIIKSLIDKLPDRIDIEDLNIIKPSSTETYQLFSDFKEGNFKSDKEAQIRFFPDKSNSRINYWRLKKDLFEKVANTYTLLGRQKSNATQRAYFEIYRDFFIANDLMASGENLAFISLAEKTIDKAIKYQISDLICSLCRKVLAQHSNINYNKSKLEKYREIAKKYRNIRNAEEELEDILFVLASEFSNSRNRKVNSKLDMEYSLNHALEVFQKYPTIKIGTYYFIIRTTYTEIKNDVLNTLYFCKEAITFFEKQETIVPIGYLFMFQHKLINAYIRLRQFDKAETIILAALNTVPKYSSDWHIAMLYKGIAALHAGKYKEAKEVVKIALERKKELYSPIAEDYKILAAYSEFFLSEGNSFRLGKFLNEVPVFSKDKRGNNINILIIQILFLLCKKQFSKIIDRTESLSQYVHNHLREDDTLRSNCFVKMLCKLPDSHFNSIAWKRNTKSLYSKMTTLELGKRRMDIDIEKVPYEFLFEKVLNMLK